MRLVTAITCFALGCPQLSLGEASNRETQCMRNMRRVFEAVQTYRRLHQGIYPERLMELGHLGLIGGELDICPCVIDSMPFSSRPGGTWSSGGEGLESGLAYQYELSSRPIDRQLLPSGVQATWRQLKLTLAERLGWEEIPVLRCERHPQSRGRLNVTFSGHGYSSGTHWEELFVDTVPFTYRAPYLAFTRNVPPFQKHSVTTDYHIRCVNLDSVANAIPADPWWWGNGNLLDGKPAATLKPLLDQSAGGLLTIGEDVYDVRSLVQVQGTTVPANEHGRGFNMRCFPEGREIPLDRAFREAKLLCGTVWEGPNG